MVVNMGLEEQIGEYESLKLKDYAPVVADVGDIHCNYGRLEQACERAIAEAQGGKAVIVMDDMFDHFGRLPVYQKFGAQDPFDLQVSYLAQKVEGEEKEILAFVAAVEKYGGPDQYLAMAKQQMPSFDEKQFMSQYQQVVEQFKLRVAPKIKLSQEEMEEAQVMLAENEKRLVAADRAMDYAQARPYAKIIDKYSDKLLFIVKRGNHDSATAIQAIYDQLENKDALKVGDRIKGAIEVGSLKFQMAGNVFGITNPSDIMVYGNQVGLLYDHMLPSKSVTDDISKLEETSFYDVSRSRDFLRITNNQTEMSKLDALLLHSELGNPLGVESRYAAIDDMGIAYLAKNHLAKDGAIVAHHLHSTQEGKNSLGVSTIRHHSVLITKKAGLMFEKLEYEQPFIEYEYDMEVLVPLFEKFYRQMTEHVDELAAARQQKRAA